MKTLKRGAWGGSKPVSALALALISSIVPPRSNSGSSPRADNLLATLFSPPQGKRMFSDISRRRFVTAAAGTALAGLGDFSFLDSLPHLEGAAGPTLPDKVQVSSDVEPLVRLIEDTSRDKVIEKVADKVRTGTSYQELLSALFLATNTSMVTTTSTPHSNTTTLTNGGTSVSCSRL